MDETRVKAGGKNNLPWLLFINREEGSDMFLRNDGLVSTGYIASYP
jgi:hypothetical protein